MSRRRKERCPAHFAALVLLIIGVPLAEAGSPSGIPKCPIVFTQLPPRPDLEKLPGAGGETLRRDYGDGGRIVRLDPDGRLHVLTAGFASACDTDVSFDGKRVLFSAKRDPADAWNIWEMSTNGAGARQITRDADNCRTPAYQATLYTIVATEPWHQIMFVSDVARTMNEYGCGPATSLYSCRLDGSALRRLTLNLSDDLDPFLMADGRVLLASWQRMDLRRGLGGRISLFGVNTDGTDYALFCGDQGRRVKHMPCVTADGLVVFVESNNVGWDGAGQLGSVTLRRNFHSYRPITTDESVVYHSPTPLPDGSVLVSRRPADGSATLGLYRLNPHTGRAQLVFDDPDSHDVQARALAPRPQPDGRSSVVNEKHATGKLYCLNAYITDPHDQAHWEPGMIKRLRVIEGVPVPASAGPVYLPGGRNTGAAPGSTVNNLVPIVQKRLLGVVPVEEDGSFHIEVPADTSVQLQLLDERGMALRTCGWIWAKHREPRGCIGCHEDPELTPENRFVQAVQKPGVKLALPPGRRRTVDFRRDVMPIIAAKCRRCHQDDATPPNLSSDKTGHFNRAYVSLLAAPTNERDRQAGTHIRAGQARSSPLIWRLYGQNTSRPWDEAYDPEQRPSMCPPPGAEPLTDNEKTTFIEWIDLGAHWNGVPPPDASAKPTQHDTHNEGRQ